MPDSRNDNDDQSEAEDSGKSEQDFPCIKCYSTIDAPMDKGMSFDSLHESTYFMTT
jgi:hypothetical protein